MSNFSRWDRVMPDKDIAWRNIGGQAVLVSIPEGHLHLLNEVGTAIWEHIQKEKRVGEIVAGVCDEFSVSEEVARRDVRDFVAELVEAELCSVASNKNDETETFRAGERP